MNLEYVTVSLISFMYAPHVATNVEIAPKTVCLSVICRWLENGKRITKVSYFKFIRYLCTLLQGHQSVPATISEFSLLSSQKNGFIVDQQ